MIKHYIETTLDLIIYMFQHFFDNYITSAWLYIFAIIVIIVIFKKVVGIE